MIFSVRKITQAGLNVEFSKDKVNFVQVSSGKIIKSGYIRHNLWCIDLPLVPTSSNIVQEVLILLLF